MNRRSCLSLFTAVISVVIAGCGGGGSTPPPPAAIAVALSPQPPSSIDANASTNLTAVVSNDSANAGVKWTVTCSSSSCGTLSASTSASGVATKYTAPAKAPSPATVTVIATSVTDGTKSAQATITISAPSAPISVALNAPPASLVAGATASLMATVSNDSANAGVSWSVTCGSSSCGSFNPANTPSGTATAYTAPAAVPTPATVTVTATSVTDTTKSASASITITAPPPVLVDGTYVFHLAGQDGNGYYYVAGAFTVANGVITGGEQDMIDGGGLSNDSISATGSSLSLANGNIQVVLNTADPNVGVAGIETMHGTVVSNARVLVSEFDTFATASGSIDAQTSAAAPSGGYAFSVGGQDGTANQNTFGVGGIINISGSSIVVASSVFDYNDLGNVSQNQSFTSGTVTAADSFGRVIITLTPSAASGITCSTPPCSFALAGYPVSASQMQLVETQDTIGATLGGMALGQGANTGRFSQAAVVGASYAFSGNGQDAYNSSSTVFQIGGGLGLQAGSAVTGVVVLNDLSNHSAGQITSGTYSVDATGRVTLNVTSNLGGSSVPFAFQLYLDGNGNALELGVDANQVSFGNAYLQQASGSDYEGNFALNAYGFGSFNQGPAWSATGPITIASDNIAGSTDFSVQNGNNSASAVTPSVTLTGTETSSTGLFNFTGLSATLDPQATSGFGYYPIDNQRVLAIELDAGQTGILMLEQVQPN